MTEPLSKIGHTDLAQASWWYPEDPAPEHGVWKSNANVLTRSEPPYDPMFGSTEFRALLCKVYPVVA